MHKVPFCSEISFSARDPTELTYYNRNKMVSCVWRQLKTKICATVMKFATRYGGVYDDRYILWRQLKSCICSADMNLSLADIVEPMMVAFIPPEARLTSSR